MDLRIGMNAMSASPVGLPLSLISEHKVVGAGKPLVSSGMGGGPVANGMEAAAVMGAPAAETAAAAPSAPAVAAAAPSAPSVAVGAPSALAVAMAPPAPAALPAVPPAPAVPATPAAAAAAAPQPAIQPSVDPPVFPLPEPSPQNKSSSPHVLTGETAPAAPGSGSNAVGGDGGEVEGSSVVADVPSADLQPCVPSATVPPDQVDTSPGPAAAAEATPAPGPVKASEPPSQPEPVQNPPAPVEAAHPPQPIAKPAEPAPATVAPPPHASPETPKIQKSHKRKTPAESEPKKTKEKEVPKGGEDIDDGRRSKRMRLPTQPYQSPLPELNIIAKMNSTPKTPKPNEDKLIVFYRNEFLAVRNAQGGFYVCQALRNIYRTSTKIKIRWLSQQANDTFTPDFYDTTEFDCILTNLNLDKVKKDTYKLPTSENQRTQSILKRAMDVEKGIAKPGDSLTEEHPDGLDLSLYRHEDQLKKKQKKKKEGGKSVKKSSAKGKQGKVSDAIGAETDDSPSSNAKKVSAWRKVRGKGKGGKVTQPMKKTLPDKRKSAETSEKKETDKGARKSTAVASTTRRGADKTKSQAVAAKSVPAVKVTRSTRTSAAAESSKK